MKVPIHFSRLIFFMPVLTIKDCRIYNYGFVIHYRYIHCSILICISIVLKFQIQNYSKFQTNCQNHGFSAPTYLYYCVDLKCHAYGVQYVLILMLEAVIS